MQTQILTDPNCFYSLEKEWLELLSRSAINQVFLTPQFLRSWWETLGSDGLRVITVRDESENLIGIAPFFLSENENGNRQLQFVGCTTVSDYADIVVDRQKSAEVYAHIFGVLQNEVNDWQAISLISVPQNSPTLLHFSEFAQKNGWQFEQKQQDVCPVIGLPKTWDEYLVNIGKKQRHEIKRKSEKLALAIDAQFVLIENPDKIAAAIDDFIRLHQHSSVDKKNFWDEKHVHFFQKLAKEVSQNNWLKLYFLEIENTRVAAMLIFDYDNQFFLYNSGFDADQYRQLSVGNVLTAHTIKEAIQLGKVRYDFLRGDEEYKYRFGAIDEPIYDLTLRKMG